MSRVTLEEATALADQWKAEREDHERAPNAGYFRDATPHDVTRMWKTGKGPTGKKLTERELGCLVERWVEVFGSLPPHGDETPDEVVPARQPDTELPADDTVLRAGEVERLTGLTRSTFVNRRGTLTPYRRAILTP